MNAALRIPSVTFVIVWSVASGAAAGPPGPADPARIAVGAAIGISSPADESVTQVYPGSHVPWSLDVDVRVVGHLSAYAGFRSLAVDGQASGFDPAGGISFDTRLETQTLLCGVRLHGARGRLGFFAGGGTARTSYTETWPGADARFSSSVWGPALHGGVTYGVSRRFGLLGRVDYLRAATGEGSLLDKAVNLGGLDVSAGITIRF